MTQNSLAIFTKASQMLAEADTIQKAKELKNLALTAAEWAKRKKMGEGAIQHCRSYAFEAERKMGRMLKAAEKNKGGRPSKTSIGHIEVSKIPDYGISHVESAEAQMLADLPEADFEKIKTGKKTIVSVKREAKERTREARREENRAVIAAVPPASLIASQAKFATIVVDPPWDFGDEGDQDQFGRARPDYATMGIQELLNLPVGELADVDSHLYLWITNRSLPKGFALLDKWGFRYVTALTWVKPHFGMGNYFRGQTEHVLFGVRGSQSLKRKDIGTVFHAPRGKGHSAKPEEFFTLVESCSHGPYLEMFSRCNRDGWTAWGQVSAAA